MGNSASTKTTSSTMNNTSTENVTREEPASTEALTRESTPTVSKVGKKRIKKKKVSSRIEGLKRANLESLRASPVMLPTTGNDRVSGTAGPEVYNERVPTIHNAVTELDQNPPDQILDLCLIMDCTGSMSSWIAHCKNTLNSVIDDTVAKDENCKVRVSFVGYRDFCDRCLFAIHDFSYNHDAVKTFIQKQSATGGGDAPEDVQGGLRKALDLSWSATDDSVKLAFLVADAPCHGSQYHGENDHYPNGNPAGLILEDLVKEFSDREILLTCYKLTDSTENMYNIMKESYNTGAEEDGIEFVDIRGQVSDAQSCGVSLHSAAMEDCYATNFNASKSLQISKQRRRKKGW